MDWPLRQLSPQGFAPFAVLDVKRNDGKLTVKGEKTMNSQSKKTCVLTAAIWIAVAGTALATPHENGRMQPGSIAVDRQATEWTYPKLARITLQEALQIVADETDGRVMKLDLRSRDGFLVYEAKAVSPYTTVPYQSLMRVTVDAGTGTVLDLREAGQDHGTEKRRWIGSDRSRQEERHAKAHSRTEMRESSGCEMVDEEDEE
jgi:uncharacterized membrane protein YkoI